jgi:AcrR family transcriptional regulator
MPTRDDILAAAEQVIRQHGLGGATTKRIAEVAGCSEGSIYNHFANKQDLVTCTVAARMRSFPAEAKALPDQAGSGTVVGNLHTLATSAVRFFSNGVPMMAAMMGEPDEARAHARAIDAQGSGPRWVMRSIVEYLRREQDLDRVAPDADLEGAAICLVGACLQQGFLAYAWGPDLLLLDDSTAATQVARTVARGLGADLQETHDA